jgi:broad specificity phosphatase PhoE
LVSALNMDEQIKKIYIIRHGETDFNRKGIVQGSGVDSDLNELGQKQAQAFYEFYKHIKFDKIYTSKLKRTHQSVNNFIKDGQIWQQHYGLNEISWGTREGKLPDIDDNHTFNKILNDWQSGITHVGFEEGESPEDVVKRQREFLDEYIGIESEKTILIAMHGRALRILLANIINNDLSKMDDYEHTNLCLYVLHYKMVSKTFEVELSNDTSHLNNLNITQ